MTQFCTRNIPILFGMQFLSFLVSTTEKCFCQILTTFPSPNTIRGGKVKNRARMTWFCTRIIPTRFRVQLLSFLVDTAKRTFGQILATFSGPNTTREGKVENRTRMTRFCNQNIPRLCGVQFLLFPVSTAEKCFGQILTTFLGPDTTKASPEQANLETRPG